MPSEKLPPENLQSLRPESILLNWSLCDRSQKLALKKITDILVSALQSLNEESQFKAERQHSFYDSTTVNRTSLLSGVRGSGKTSVLKSLYAITTDPQQRRKFFDLRFHSESTQPESTRLQKNGIVQEDLWATHIQNELSQIDGRLKWLDPIDMEVLPGPCNLLAAILCRIEEAVSPRIESAARRSGSATEESLIELRELMQDVTVAWDGNMPERGQHLDPDTYAAEVVRAERARVRIPDRVSQVLDDLSGKKPGHLYVLPVDDFDMSPTRCMELLRLIRMLNVPRLFTIVLGDADSTNAILQTKLTGDFARVADIRLHADVLDREIYRRHRQVALDAMRKLIPNGQRVHLSNMSKWEALEFSPTAGRKKLKEILKAITIPVPDRNLFALEEVCLANFLFGDVEPDRRCLTTSAGILVSPPRVVADLWQQFLPLVNSNTDEKIEALISITNDRLAAWHSSDEAERFGGVFQQYTLDSQIEWTTNAQGFKTSIDKCQVQHCKTQHIDAQIRVLTGGDWTVSYERSTQDLAFLQQNSECPDGEVRPQVYLKDEVLPYFTLCHDVIVSTQSNNIVPSFAAPRHQQVSVAATQIQLTKNRIFTLSWPTPEFKTFIEWDCFVENWAYLFYDNSNPNKRKTITDYGQSLPVLWTWACLSAVGGALKDVRTEMFGEAPLDVDSLEIKVDNELVNALKGPQPQTEFLARFFVLFAPEYRLGSVDLLKRLLINDDTWKFCCDNRDLIREARALALAEACQESSSWPSNITESVFLPIIACDFLDDWFDGVRNWLKRLIEVMPADKKQYKASVQRMLDMKWKARNVNRLRSLVEEAFRLMPILDVMPLADVPRPQISANLEKILRVVKAKEKPSSDRNIETDRCKFFYDSIIDLTRKQLKDAGVPDTVLRLPD